MQDYPNREALRNAHDIYRDAMHNSSSKIP